MVGKTLRIPVVLISNHEAQADSDPGHQGQDPGDDIGVLMPECGSILANHYLCQQKTLPTAW